MKRVKSSKISLKDCGEDLRNRTSINVFVHMFDAFHLVSNVKYVNIVKSS
jgi:hypothetical protein